MTAWRDISTAPRDGTVVYVKNEDFGFLMMRWNGDRWAARGDVFFWPDNEPEPTHWLPLTEQPAIAT